MSSYGSRLTIRTLRNENDNEDEDERELPMKKAHAL